MGKYRSHGWHLIILFTVVYMIAVFGTGAHNKMILGASIGILISWFAWLFNYGFHKYKKWRMYRNDG